MMVSHIIEQHKLNALERRRRRACVLSVEQAVRIASICFSRGPGGCVCAVMMMIKPAW